jgi:hypothetical protein
MTVDSKWSVLRHTKMQPKLFVQAIVSHHTSSGRQYWRLSDVCIATTANSSHGIVQDFPLSRLINCLALVH